MKLFVVVAILAVLAIENVSGIMCPQYMIMCQPGQHYVKIDNCGCGIQQCIDDVPKTGIACSYAIIACPAGQKRIVYNDGECGRQFCIPATCCSKTAGVTQTC